MANLKVLKHTISKVSNDIVKIEGRGYAIDSGACTKDIEIGDKKLTLLSTREILEKVNEDDILLIPAKENGNNGWSSNKPFAIVVKKDNHHRLGLVEIKGEGLEKLQQGAEKLKVIEVNDINFDQKLDFEELFERIEIPPKQK